eukprot:scaffold81396_cov15-Prasinocladus_malaysianus.AAC.1
MVDYKDIRAEYLMRGYFTTGSNGCVRQWDEVTSKQSAKTSTQRRGLHIRTTAPSPSATRVGPYNMGNNDNGGKMVLAASLLLLPG